MAGVQPAFPLVAAAVLAAVLAARGAAESQAALEALEAMKAPAAVVSRALEAGAVVGPSHSRYELVERMARLETSEASGARARRAGAAAADLDGAGGGAGAGGSSLLATLEASPLALLALPAPGEQQHQPGEEDAAAATGVPLLAWVSDAVRAFTSSSGALRHAAGGGERVPAAAEDGSGAGEHGYAREEPIGRGHYGEVWRAHRADDPGGGAFVLKRLFVERGERVRMSGFREVHFGKRLAGLSGRIARFVEHFEDAETGDLWLVFRHEGRSLRSWMYAGGSLQAPSAAWHALKADAAATTPGAGSEMRALLGDLLMGAAVAHRHGVLHRDIKPANVLLRDGGGLALCDFGSAVDMERPGALYGAGGPSQAEETERYAPPEVVFSPRQPFDAAHAASYDVWSAGVVFLELILGSPDVFRVSDRTRAMIETRMAGAPPELRRRAVTFRALVEYCVYEAPPPQATDGREDRRLPPPECNDAVLGERLAELDPLGQGAPSEWALRLLRRMLAWSPERRVTAEHALRHAYFHGPHTCPVCGAEHEFPEDLQRHLSESGHRHVQPPPSSGLAAAEDEVEE